MVSWNMPAVRHELFFSKKLQLEVTSYVPVYCLQGHDTQLDRDNDDLGLAVHFGQYSTSNMYILNSTRKDLFMKILSGLSLLIGIHRHAMTDVFTKNRDPIRRRTHTENERKNQWYQ